MTSLKEYVQYPFILLKLMCKGFTPSSVSYPMKETRHLNTTSCHVFRIKFINNDDVIKIIHAISGIKFF